MSPSLKSRTGDKRMPQSWPLETVSRSFLNLLIENLKSQGAEKVILGCTDLPLLMKQEDFPLPLIDTTNVMAQAVVTMNNSNGGLL